MRVNTCLIVKFAHELVTVISLLKLQRKEVIYSYKKSYTKTFHYKLVEPRLTNIPGPSHTFLFKG